MEPLWERSSLESSNSAQCFGLFVAAETLSIAIRRFCMRHFITIVMAVVLTAGLLGIAGQDAIAAEKGLIHHLVKKDAAAVAISEKPLPTNKILFFMNPNGHPCQMQNAILDEIKDSLAGLATVTYIKTTEPGDRDAFETYGIRGLPFLIIVDKNGKELKRFTPGIQSKEAILAALREKTK
jgi:thiol-disulfide isomerase/thioredoxin